MRDLLTEIKNNIFYITFNRIDKHNAFDDNFLTELDNIINEANSDSDISLIVIKANGKHFSAGADLNWMRKMADFTEEENFEDAKILSNLMYNLYNSPKPTLALVNGGAYGGGAGIVSVCDIVIADIDAKFSFSEVKLNLIPAVISPYVINAIGRRSANWLFISGQTITAERALKLNLIHIITDDLSSYAEQYIKLLQKLHPDSIKACKNLVREIADHPIDKQLSEKTAHLIAKRRSLGIAKEGIKAFLKHK